MRRNESTQGRALVNWRAPKLLGGAFVALLFAAACPGVTRPLEKPTVKLESVAVTNASLAGLDARASFTMTNPNSIGLPLRAFDWQLSIGDAAPVRGRATLSETLPAKGAAPVLVDLHVSAAAAVETATAIAGGADEFRLAGTLHFETRLGDLAVTFDETGPLGDLPR